jgi:4-amino-4-deoxy-L-arabinose transferase-like glycosyltransferase
LQINEELNLPYLNIPSEFNELAVMVVGTAMLQLAKEILNKVYNSFVFVSCGVGCLTRPFYVLGIGYISLWIVSQLGFWHINASQFMFLIMGLVTGFAKFKEPR